MLLLLAIEKIGNLLLKFLPSNGPVRKCEFNDFVEAEDCIRLGVKVLHVDRLTIDRECAPSLLILDRLRVSFDVQAGIVVLRRRKRNDLPRTEGYGCLRARPLDLNVNRDV